jgi:hypothetical protein
MSFAALKQSRQAQLDKLVTEVSKLSQPATSSGQENDDFWKPDVDKAGNGYAVIRFLPAPEGEDVPFARVWDHGFQGPGGWYIEKSLTTIGQKDPVSEHNTILWNSGIDANKDIVRKQKRRLSYYANIMVVKDPANPDNEGKVFYYRFGKKIWDKIEEAMNPAFEDEKAVNPFDLWEGANFKLKIRNVEGYRNYDKSEFDSPSALADSDDELEAIWKQERSLATFTDPKNFKSYDELKTKLDRVLGLTGESKPNNTAADLDDELDARPMPQASPAPIASSDDDDDDSMDFFKKLADE